MQRFNEMTHKSEEHPEVDKMLLEVDALCQKYSLVIEHEDFQGSFVITRLRAGEDGQTQRDWLLHAAVSMEAPSGDA